MEYPIYNGEDTVGIAQVSKEGLYYRIHCTCNLVDSEPFRITAKAEHQIDLGMCVPNGDIAGLKVRIPMKKLGEGNLSFSIGKRNEDQQEEWFPVSPQEPFLYIAKLKTACTVSRNGKVGIAFKVKDQFLTQRDNDQSP